MKKSPQIYARDPNAYTDRMMNSLADGIANHIAWQREMAESNTPVPPEKDLVMEMLYRYSLQTSRGW